MDNKPKQYQQGWAEFYKLRFKVTPDVLIPRPETEILIDEVLNFIHQLPNTSHPITILDIGTGSGAIAISIAKNYLPINGVGTQIFATDISQKVLKIARQNAKLHQVKDKITFIKSDLLCNLGGCTLSPDIIITNLPYIPSERIAYLDSSVKDFEPHIALDGGEDGFELYRKLFKQIVKFSLPPQGWKPKLILGEIDYTHGDLAFDEAYKFFPKAEIEVKKDLAKKQRFLFIRS